MPETLYVPAEIVTLRSSKMLLVRARLNDRRPYRLLVDTGASQTVVSLDAASDIGLRNPRAARLHTVGQTRAGTVYDLDSIIVLAANGQEIVRGPLEAITADWDPILEEIYQGLLGMDWLTSFRRVCLRFDLDPPMLELHEP